MPCVSQIEDALLPAEQGIVGVTGLLGEMRPLLDDLRKDVTTGTMHANEAQNQADSAQDEAEQAAEVRKQTILMCYSVCV